MNESPASYPLVSVVTATYNRAALLPETIESILSQDYPNVEYIVLDDGSTDATRDVLARYQGRIIWESHPNMGETRTVNKGWGMARGEFVVTVSSDDPVRPGLLSTGVRFLQSHPEVLVAYPGFTIIDEHSKVIYAIDSGEYDYLKMLRWHHCYPGPGTFIRRKCFELAGMRDPQFRYVGDYEYWLRVGLHGPFARIPQVLANWRSHPGAATHAIRDLSMAEEHVQMIENFFARPELPPEVRAVRRAAISAANFTAGDVCVTTDLRAARRYYRRCLMVGRFRGIPKPSCKPFPWHRVLPLVLSEPVYRVARSCWLKILRAQHLLFHTLPRVPYRTARFSWRVARGRRIFGWLRRSLHFNRAEAMARKEVECR